MNWLSIALNGFVIGLKRYAEFGGRSGRSEYWFFFIVYFIIYMTLTGFDVATGQSMSWPTTFFTLAMLVPSIAIGVRRLHDIDRSGWWLAITLVPIVGAIVLLFFSAQDSTPGNNRFGAHPRAIG